MLLFAHLGLALAAARFVSRADLVFVAIGSMLPDIIDKPLGEIIYGTPSMGRIFAHTLLFLLLLAGAAFYTRDLRLASLCGGVLVHLSLDFMWNSPAILFWPMLGSFPPAPHLDTLSYLQMLLLGLRNPSVLLPELLGLAYFIFLLVEKRLNIASWTRLSIARICTGARSLPHIFLKGS
ncbi:MAG: metal-dependent hydrolase [Methanotrichaceae archaeon]|nr:metal-dependent hydrolase [Methanotrichaceae archaeon]